MKHDNTLYLALALTGLLAGCSTTNLGLNPTVPEQAGGSIAKAAIRLKDAECQKKPEKDRPTCKAETYGLDEVKLAFDSLYDGTRNASNTKNKQEWAYGEVASTGGFGAVVGQLASQTALLNSGIALATVGLSMDSFYKPGTTKATHLRAEVMFQCLQRELSYVSETDRLLGESAADSNDDEKKAMQGAVNAVRNAVEQIDAAITTYRRSVLTQALTLPSAADFSSFAKRYTADSATAESLAGPVANKLTIAFANADKKQIDQAKANAAAAKFVMLQAKLETCVRGFGS